MQSSVAHHIRITTVALVATFFFVGFLVYGHILSHSFVRWDDGLLIYENPSIRGINLQTLKDIFTTYDPELYIPLTLFSYQIDFLLSGTKAGFYHFHSLILHIINALLVVWLLKKIQGNQWIAVVAGLLFLLHPLNTEAVAWASGRKDLLSTMWMLVSWGWFVASCERMQRMYALSIAAFTLGLLCKATIITLPALLILTAYYKRWKIDRALLLRIVPYVILSCIFAVIALHGKTAVLDSSTRLEKVLIAPMSTVFYLQKLLLPTGLSVIYPLTGDITFWSVRILLPILLCISLLAVGIWSLRYTRLLFVCLGIFVVALSPSLLNFSKGDFLYFASDRYAYTASIGIILLVVCGLNALRQHYRSAVSVSTAILLCTLGILASAQSRVWATSETLFTHTIENYPEAHSAHNNLGNIYRIQGKSDAAIVSYLEALRLSREFGRGSQALYGESKILTNLASAYRDTGEQEKAENALQEAESLDPLSPHVFLQKGIFLGVKGDITGAENAYRRAIELRPHFTSAEINLASLLINTTRAEEAIVLLEDTLQWNPYYPQAFYNLAAAYRTVGRQREAFDTYKKAVELEPSFVAARINLGILYAERGKQDEAIEQFSEVLKYDPQNQRAQSALQQLGARE